MNLKRSIPMIHPATNTVVERQPLPRPSFWTVCIAQSIFPILVIAFVLTRHLWIGTLMWLDLMVNWVALIDLSYYMKGVIDRSSFPSTHEEARKIHRRIVFAYLFTPYFGLKNYLFDRKIFENPKKWTEFFVEEDGEMIRVIPGGPLNSCDFIFCNFEREKGAYENSVAKRREKIMSERS